VLARETKTKPVSVRQPTSGGAKWGFGQHFPRVAPETNHQAAIPRKRARPVSFVLPERPSDRGDEEEERIPVCFPGATQGDGEGMFDGKT
jgi:hypothetical protein